jgi:crotonobetaine/carnitine-CoA ligase
MRIKGENVSAYEVEHTIQKHPSVLEAAVYAVPSELAEDEIMASVSLVEGHALKEADLVESSRRSGQIRRSAFCPHRQRISQNRNTANHQKRTGEDRRCGGTYDAQKNQYVGAQTRIKRA